MISNGLASEWQGAGIVGVAPEWAGSIGAHVRGGEPRHGQQSLVIFIRNVESETSAIQSWPHEQFEYKSMIGTGRLVVHAVRKHLPRELGDQIRPAEPSPSRGISDIAEEQTSKHQAREVGGIVVAIDIGLFDVPEREVPVKVERRQKSTAERLLAPRWAARKNMEKPSPRQDTQCRLHRACPIHGIGKRIGLNPFVYDVSCGRSITFVSREEVRLTSRDQPLQSRYLPGNLHVTRSVAIHEIDRSRKPRTPAKICTVVA